MKSLLIAINAKYIHTGLSVLSLAAAAKKAGYETEVMQFTINQQDALLIREIYLQKPDLLGISCYIWNIAAVRRLLPALRTLLPECVIALGGPEVSFGGEELFDELPCDIILQGEGEISFPALVSAVFESLPLNTVPFALISDGKSVLRTEDAKPMDMDALPFPYDNNTPLENRIAYYETSRGCPFSCGYCLSGGKYGVRYRSLSLVFTELDWFLEKRLAQVKLVDRTFNCDPVRALEIWKYLSLHDNGVTNFHFEIAAELLTEEQLSFLKTVRAGQFQFEIGIQSTHRETLREIHRITIPEKLTPKITELIEAKKQHLHLDLIAGLPNEGYSDFRNSYNYVYSLMPHQLQLGFLKLLKGSDLYQRRESLGIAFNSEPPYEVLFTPQLSYSELLSLKLVEEMTERYYNAGRFRVSLQYLVSVFETPFDCFQAFGNFYAENGYLNAPHNKNSDYEILFEFFCSIDMPKEETERFRYLCLFDFCLQEKPRRFPDFLKSGFQAIFRAVSEALHSPAARDTLCPEYSEYDLPQLMRMLHAEPFPFDPRSLQASNSKLKPIPQETVIFFNYKAASSKRLDL